MKGRGYYAMAMLLLGAACVSRAAPYGSTAAQDFAAKLWQQMSAARLVGEGAFHSRPYPGAAPHGEYIDTIDGYLSVADRRGRLIVARNYRAEALSQAMVMDAPERYLQTVTVMFQREAGYDRENGDWFWVEYAPDGALRHTPDGVAKAGRVAKGEDGIGCIACHRAAPGGDMVYGSNR